MNCNLCGEAHETAKCPELKDMLEMMGDLVKRQYPHAATVIAAAKARIEAMEDHTLIASAIISGIARWEPFRGQQQLGEICCNGLRYCTKLDEFGVPTLHCHVRAAIAKAKGENNE